MKKNNGINFDNTYTNLDPKLYSMISPNNYVNPDLVIYNSTLASDLGIDIDFLKSAQGLSFLSGSSKEFGPYFSQAYAGHQYEHFTMLGDGRALMLGEQITPTSKRFDLQLKGSGRTPYSRRGDGKATLSSMLREYLISEAMNGLGVPTTRSLAVVETGEMIQRVNFEKGAILTRVASSHIRVGTFEYAKVYGSKETVQELADYTIDRHYPTLDKSENKYIELLREIIRTQASLIAKWQSVGFIHGVMNTDNVLISGETIDYGPCAFMNHYDPKTVYSSIDANGRYAYQNQPYIASWNISRFAEAILELLDESQEKAIYIANEELKKFGKQYKKYWLENMSLKLGIKNPTDEDEIVVNDLLTIMNKYRADYTNTFSALTKGKFENIVFYDTEDWTEWFKKWTRALGYRRADVTGRIEVMKQANPTVIPRNHIVEKALLEAVQFNDYGLFHQLLDKVSNPYDYYVKHDDAFTRPTDEENYKTYCGT